MGKENTGKRKRGQTKRKAFNQPSINPPRKNFRKVELSHPLGWGAHCEETLNSSRCRRNGDIPCFRNGEYLNLLAGGSYPEVLPY